MDLSFLIPSKIRRQVLAYFVDNPEAEVGIRELGRELKISPQQTFRELCNLEGWGFLFSSRRVTQRAFRRNERFPLAPPIDSLFKIYKMERERKYEVHETINAREYLKKISKIPASPELLERLKSSKSTKPRSWDGKKVRTSSISPRRKGIGKRFRRS